MHEYMTRHMVALKQFTYADWPLEPGDEFRATPDDAGYLTRHGKAKPADVPFALAQTVQVAVAAAPVAAVAAVPPPAVEPVAAPLLPASGQAVEAVGMTAITEPAVQAATEPAATAADEPADSPAVEPVAVTSRRRGRPSNAEREARQAAEAGTDTQAAIQP